ncbi:SigE family RNA polymerase sigma factor [Streptomyces sp. NPDC049040]|uniref:SigE family RNA polymerase sigma factor n=1 Tax=Streptomyces sp. NPDC049040 TaxID=3365593 RepID=UPI003717C7D1
MRDRPTDRDEDFVGFAASRRTHLFRTAFLLCGNRHAAEDLLQQTLERVYVSWSRVRRADEPDAYVHKIMINEHSRFLRRRRRESLVTDVPEPREPATAGSGWAETRPQLLAALAALPLRQRQAVVLRYWEDLSETQAAAAMGCSVGAVKSQASRGIARLRLAPSLGDLTPTGGIE